MFKILLLVIGIIVAIKLSKVIFSIAENKISILRKSKKD